MSTDTTPTPRELRARADAITDQAKGLRKDLLEWHETRLSEVGIARDRAAREQYAAEQSAKSADIQVKREKADVDKMNKGAAELEADALAAEKKGDVRAAEEHRELAADYRNSAEIHSARARQAELDAAELREQAAQHARRVVQLETQKTDLVDAGSAASAQIDRMEDQARLFQEAAQKMTMAEMLREADVPGTLADVDKRVTEVATLEVQAEDALEKANDMDIDRAKITDVLPNATFATDDSPVSTSSDSTVTDSDATVMADADLDTDVPAGNDGDLDTTADADADTTADADADAPDTGVDTDTPETTTADITTDVADDELDTEWLQEYLDEPASDGGALADLSDVEVTDSGFDMEPAEVAFADALSGGDIALDDTDDTGGLDDFA